MVALGAISHNARLPKGWMPAANRAAAINVHKYCSLENSAPKPLIWKTHIYPMDFDHSTHIHLPCCCCLFLTSAFGNVGARIKKEYCHIHGFYLCTFILPFRVVMFTFFSVFLFCPTYFVDAFYYSLEDDDAPVNSPKSWWIHRSICFAAHFSSQYSSKYWCCHIWISSIIMIINIKCIRMWCLRIYCEMILECVADFLIEWHRSYRVVDVKR